ncbi:MAG TPA: hypothetical protein VFF19_00110 [Reyranella sp.]|nr:hypothetical protein [Reyranella sp.]
MSRVLSVLLALMAVGWTQPATAEPAAQAAFRAVLVKFDQRADAETDIGRLRTFAAERAGELAQVLGQGLGFAGWDLILSAAEATPMGGIFLRLHDDTLSAPRSVRPTYWNSGPGAIMRQAEITPKSPLHRPLALLKRGTLVVVSGSFFAGDNGGPFYESARISFQDLEIERARFRMPYFSIRIEEIREVFPERRFP